MEEKKWLDWAIKIQAIAQAGLYYGKDKFDLERYEELRDIAAEIIEYKSNIPKDKVKDLFCNEIGYQTPKIETRAAVFNEQGQILLIKEGDGTWCLPGGWADVDLSPKENILKEVYEEAGLEVEIEKVVAIQDRKFHNEPQYAYGIYKLFAICKKLGGAFKENLETIDSQYFSEEDLPENLSLEKINLQQIKMCFQANKDPNWSVYID